MPTNAYGAGKWDGHDAGAMYAELLGDDRQGATYAELWGDDRQGAMYAELWGGDRPRIVHGELYATGDVQLDLRRTYGFPC